MLYQTIQNEPVPALGLGTYRLKGTAGRAAVAEALDIGYRHIDTAQSYENEGDVGHGIADSAVERSDIFITTKIWMSNLSAERVRTSTEESLRKLKTDYVDLLLIHWPGHDVPLQETLDAMLRLMENGRTRHIGVSNFPPDLVRRATRCAPIFCNQVEYHPFLAQDELLSLAVDLDFLLTAYTPIARGQVMKDETILQIAAAHGKSPVQVTLRWHLQQENVAAIPKAADARHRRSNFDIFDFELSEDEMDRISALGRGLRFVDPQWAPEW